MSIEALRLVLSEIRNRKSLEETNKSIWCSASGLRNDHKTFCKRRRITPYMWYVRTVSTYIICVRCSENRWALKSRMRISFTGKKIAILCKIPTKRSSYILRDRIWN